MRAVVEAAPAGEQQARLREWLAAHPSGRRAVIAESAFTALAVPDDVALAQLAPGCVCCVGQAPLRVTLLRTVRSHRPDDVLLLLASGDHLPRVRTLLADGSLGVRFDLE